MTDRMNIKIRNNKTTAVPIRRFFSKDNVLNTETLYAISLLIFINARLLENI